MFRRALSVAFVVGTLAAQGRAATLPPAQQLTPDGDGVSQSWSPRMTPVSRGKILFFDSNEAVHLFNGASIVPVQATTGQAVFDTVFTLGSGAGPSDTIGGWRRGTGISGWVSVNGGTAQEVTLNPESVAAADGCIFFALQTGVTTPEGAIGQHAFQVDPGTGSRTRVSTGTFTAGVNRVVTSGCKAAWGYQPTNADPQRLGYWDGATEHAPLDPDIAADVSTPSFAGGVIAYTKEVGGIDQVFIVDTTVAPLTPVQVSAETDASVVLHSAQTDGRHVVWYRSNADGSNAKLMLRGELVVPTPALQKLHNIEKAFHLHSGQLFWKLASGGFQYDDGRQQFDLDPSPATNAAVTHPWLTDGTIAFLAVTPGSGADKEVFRVTGTTPLAQPQPPLLVQATAGTAEVRFDPIIGATSYNAYVAYDSGVTKDNYASLDGGRKLENVTNPFTISGLTPGRTYFVVVTAVDDGVEGPSSRAGSTTLLGSLTWTPVGGLGATPFYSVAADPSNAATVYAGANGSVYKSSNGGIDWTQVLASATTGATRVHSLLVAGSVVLAGTAQAGLWRSANGGTDWSKRHDSLGFRLYGQIAADPSSATTFYAGDYDTASTLTESRVIKSVDGGLTWSHTAQGPDVPDELEGRAVAVAPTTPSAIYAGGNGNPSLARSVDGGASWTSIEIPGASEVQSLGVVPSSPNTVYAMLLHKGVYRSLDGGANWEARNGGLAGIPDTAEFYAFLVDPLSPDLLHLGGGAGYAVSIDGGANWMEANDGFGTIPYIHGLAMTPSRRLIAATSSGLYLMSFAAPPSIASVEPAKGNVAGGATVRISGSGFQTGAAVKFGATAAAVVSITSTLITATAPAHAAGAVDVQVSNPDFQSVTATNAFTYDNAPNPPASVTATAQSASSVLVSWSAVAGATSYQVERRAPGAGYVSIGTPAASPLLDSTGLLAHKSYAYRVRAVNASGASANSIPDVATTMSFTNAPLTAGTPVRAVHLAEERMAIQHVRELAGIGNATFTGTASAGLLIRALQVGEMRTALDAALTELGVPLLPYTDAALAGQRVKAVHFQQIVDRLK